MSVCCPSKLWDCLKTIAEPFQDTGAQPIVNDDGTLALAVNGEIYNHRILRKQLKTQYDFKTHSDCEVIIPLVRGPVLFLVVEKLTVSVHGTWY